jgi:hypothetical protein
MHCLFPFPPFSYDNRPDKALGMVVFLTLAEELEFQESRRKELRRDEPQQPEKPERQPAG